MAASRVDLPSRLIAVVSLMVSVAAAFFAWARTPYFDAPPEQMSYWVVESNSLTEAKTPKAADLKVVVCNASTRPARDVLVVVRPLHPNASVVCNREYEVLPGPRGTQLLTISRIPPKGEAEVHVSEKVSVYPERSSYLGGAKFRYCGSVEEAQTSFGEIRRDYKRCEETFERLPGDDGESFL